MRSLEAGERGVREEGGLSPLPGPSSSGWPGTITGMGMTPHNYARALSHPIRVEIIRVLKARGAAPFSPSELAPEIGHSLALVSHHVKALCDLGLVRRPGTKQRPNAIQHFYTLDREALAEGRRALNELV